MIAPPNSPWAAINGDFGIELVGYLSRISHLPANGKFPFRFYTHDPWWLNSPWFDRYGRNPHDIYLPLALARLDAAGKVTRPAYLEFLTVDNTWGEMPDRCPIEVTPHILRAMESYSDEPGPVTWIYPFTEYHRMTFGPGPRLDEVFFGDWFLRGAVNAGFPLNTVVSTENFAASFAARPGLYRDTVLLATIPEPGSAVEDALLEALRRGGNVLFYGPTARAGPRLLELLHLSHAEPLSGELEWQSDLPADGLPGLPPTLNYRAVLSGGGVDTVLRRPDLPGCRACATVARGAQRRVFALFRESPFGPGSGRLGWMRGCVSCSIGSGHLPVPTTRAGTSSRNRCCAACWPSTAGRSSSISAPPRPATRSSSSPAAITASGFPATPPPPPPPCGCVSRTARRCRRRGGLDRKRPRRLHHAARLAQRSALPGGAAGARRDLLQRAPLRPHGHPPPPAAARLQERHRAFLPGGPPAGPQARHGAERQPQPRRGFHPLFRRGRRRRLVARDITGELLISW